MRILNILNLIQFICVILTQKVAKLKWETVACSDSKDSPSSGNIFHIYESF
jgi:hypothetical protein